MAGIDDMLDDVSITTMSQDVNVDDDETFGNVTGKTKINQPIPNNEIIHQVILSTLKQSVMSLRLIEKSDELMKSALYIGTFDQRINAVAEANKLMNTTNETIKTTTNLIQALGINVDCVNKRDVDEFIPVCSRVKRLNAHAGLKDHEVFPSASKYLLTLTILKRIDTTPKSLLDTILTGAGCQIVARTIGNDFVTVRMENRIQLGHAVNILNNAWYKGSPLVSFCSISSLTKSAYALRSLPISSSSIACWFNTSGTLNVDLAITAVYNDNRGWFAENDVESMVFHKAAPLSGQHSRNDHVVFKLFVSFAAYKRFLRSSRDITNIVCNGTLLKFKEEVNIIQCWKCMSFGHFYNDCNNGFRCRFCTTDHQQNFNCPGRKDPVCRNCSANNQTLVNKSVTNHNPVGILFFKDWRQAEVNHIATSATCKTIQLVKCCHLRRLKQAAIANLPLPRFEFP